MDELDFLVTRQQSVLYNLFDWPQRRHARLVVIGIANTMDLPERLLPKVASRLGLGRVVFKPYTRDQIGTILTARLQGLPAFDQNAIKLAAARVANISGDVRKALQICRRAAEIASTRTAAAAAEGGASLSPKAQALAARPLVGVTDINRAADALTSDLTSKALQATRPWERLLLVALVAHVRSQVVEEVSLDDLVPRAVGLARRVRTELPQSYSAATSGSAAAAAAAGKGGRSAGKGASSSSAAPSASPGYDSDGSDYEDDVPALTLEGYRNAPADTEATFGALAAQLALSRIVAVEHRSYARKPWLRLLVQPDDVRTALRDDPLVKLVFADETN